MANDEAQTSKDTNGWRVRQNESGFSLANVNGDWQEVKWSLQGQHNAMNALAAVAAARHAGVPVAVSIEALNKFRGVKRRMEVRGQITGITIYDDFAHHPTAIATTLAGLRKQVGKQRILAVLEPRSNTMRLGIHKESLPASLADADEVYVYSPPEVDWNAASVFDQNITRPTQRVDIHDSVEQLIDRLGHLAV